MAARGNEFVFVSDGLLPIVVCAPHGGTVKPAEIPRRTRGTSEHDVASAELAHELAAALECQMGAAPTVVVNLLDRSRLDANRALDAACESELAAAAWRAYHGAISDAITNGAHLVLDVHGQSHREAIELGYALSPAELAADTRTLGAAAGERSTLRFALARLPHGTRADWISGESSLGAALERVGLAAVPGPTLRAPGSSRDTARHYFTGGGREYTAAAHAARALAVQLECPRAPRVGEPRERVAFARAVAEAVASWLGALTAAAGLAC